MIALVMHLQHAVWSMRSRLVRSERGASLVEYALLVALIAILCIVAVRFLGDATNARYSSVGSSLQSA
jgi:pilus assembly protein Flp/PilA